MQGTSREWRGQELTIQNLKSTVPSNQNKDLVAKNHVQEIIRNNEIETKKDQGASVEGTTSTPGTRLVDFT